MANGRAPRRTAFGLVAVAALTIIGIGLPTGAADASARSPWDAIAQCESGGDWSINTGNGYYGGLQFSAATWAAHGGRGSAATASRAEQIRIGTRVVATQGWEAWSGCSARLGLHGRSAAPARTQHRKAEDGRGKHRTAGEVRADLSIQAASEKRRAHRRGGTSASPKIATCSAKTLRVRPADGGAAVGARYLDLRFTNTGAHRCRVLGAARAVHLAADRPDDRLGAAALRRVEVAPKHPHLVLGAHGGHAYSRITIRRTADHGERCAPADVPILRSGSDAVDASLDGLRLQTCTDAGYQVLSLGHSRSNRSTTRR